MTSHITTHVLDTVEGAPAAGVKLTLFQFIDGKTTEIASGFTNEDGRNRELGPESLQAGVYRLVFATGDYFSRKGQTSFYPQITIDFYVEQGQEHYHVPVLLSPFGFSTYRGS